MAAAEPHTGQHVQGCVSCYAHIERTSAAERRFYVAAHPDVTVAQVLLARARSYSRLEDAFADMGDGVIFDDAGEIVAYHERHGRLLELRSRRAPGSSPRMSNARRAES